MISGTVYGVALNDRAYVEGRMEDFRRPPYGKPPVAPVLYIKPRTCVVPSGGTVRIPAHIPRVEVSATIALLFATVPGKPVAAALALDIGDPHADFYRPAIKQRCRDGYLPVGEFTGWSAALLEGDIATRVGGEEVHRWSLSGLLRDPLELIAELSSYMTLSEGDVLLIGLPGNSPTAEPGQCIEVSAPGLPSLSANLVQTL